MQPLHDAYHSLAGNATFSSWTQKFLSAARLGIIGLLTLILLWPLAQVDSLVRERSHHKQEAETEIASHSGGANTLAGPFLTLPYQEWQEWSEGEKKLRRSTKRYLHVMPEDLKVNGQLKSELRRRGLFEVPVFAGTFQLKGNFGKIPLEKLGILAEDILWEEAFLDMGLASPRGLSAPATITLGEKTLEMRPASREGRPTVLEALEVDAPLTSNQAFDFQIDMQVRGSNEVTVAPVGDRTRVQIASDWPHPSFSGSLLPETRKVGDQGFQAQWQDMGFGRGYAGTWIDQKFNEGILNASAFGVTFLSPVDTYAPVARSTKYGLLFILMTFLVLYLAETLGALRIHPLQYLLVGTGLCLFYLLLLSVAEHLGFDFAYALATLAIVLLIASYAWAMMRRWKPTLILSGMLSGLYAFLFVTLQAEDYALVMGAGGLFVLLALIMYATRSLAKPLPTGETSTHTLSPAL
jgi:inner membrane protein